MSVGWTFYSAVVIPWVLSPNYGVRKRTPFFSPAHRFFFPDKIIFFLHTQFFFFFLCAELNLIPKLTKFPKFQKLRPQSQPQPHLVSTNLQLQTPISLSMIHIVSLSPTHHSAGNGAYDLVGLTFSTVFCRFEMHSANCVHHFIHPVFNFYVGAIISKTAPSFATVLQESPPALNR